MTEPENHIAADEKPHTPESGFVEFASRLVFAASAMVGTILVGRVVLGLHEESLGEVALLNGGVAYYTHEAAGDVVKAINRLYRKVLANTKER